MKLVIIILFCINLIVISSHSQDINSSRVENEIINEVSHKSKYINENKVLSETMLLDIIRLDSMVVFGHLENLDSVSRIKYTYTYNQEENTLLIIFKYRLINNGIWLNYSKSVRTFNDQYQEIQIISYQGDGQSWIKREKSIYEYYNNNISLRINYGWDSYLYEWYLSTKYENEYDSFGNLEETISSLFNREESKWYFAWKMEYNYDQNDRVVSDIWYFWNKELARWEFSDWSNYTYHEEIQSSTDYIFESGDWKPIRKTLGEKIDDFTIKYNSFEYMEDSIWLHVDSLQKEYDDMKNLVRQESFEYKLSDSTWIGDRNDYEYNDMNQEIVRKYYKWDSELREWWLSTRFISGYNEFGALDYECVYLWDTIDSYWFKSSSTVYYFSSISEINEEKKAIDFHIYPNPCGQFLTINCKDLKSDYITYEIYSSNGRLVDSDILKHDSKINVVGLTKGFYHIRIIDSGISYAAGFIKL